jgi:hypothetical protein
MSIFDIAGLNGTGVKLATVRAEQKFSTPKRTQEMICQNIIGSIKHASDRDRAAKIEHTSWDEWEQIVAASGPVEIKSLGFSSTNYQDCPSVIPKFRYPSGTLESEAVEAVMNYNRRVFIQGREVKRLELSNEDAVKYIQSYPNTELHVDAIYEGQMYYGDMGPIIAPRHFN